MAERLSWEEIKKRYPHQYVGLVDCEPDSTNIDSAIVKYTETDMMQGEMFERAVRGEIHMRYTSPEDYPEIASNFYEELCKTQNKWRGRKENGLCYRRYALPD